METADLLAGVEAKLQEQTRGAHRQPPRRPRPPPRRSTPRRIAGRRLITLLFDVSSMQPDDVQRAVDSAQKYVDEKMSAADLVAVVTIGSTLTVLTDFTGDRAKVGAGARRARLHRRHRDAAADASTVATDEAAAAADRRHRDAKRPTSTCSTTTSGCGR